MVSSLDFFVSDADKEIIIKAWSFLSIDENYKLDLPVLNSCLQAIGFFTFLDWASSEGFNSKEDYNSRALSEFLDRETHYHLEKRGNKYDQARGSFLNLSHEEYTAARVDVAKSLLKYIIKSDLVKEMRDLSLFRIKASQSMYNDLR